MGAAIGNLNRLRHRTGAAILVIHHSGKDQSKGARGWSGLRAAVDTEIEITRDGDIRYADLGSKQRDSKDRSRVSFSLREVVLGKDEDGDVVTSCVIEELNSDLPATPIRKKPLPKAQQAIIDIIEELRVKGDATTMDRLRRECAESYRVSAAETLKDRRDAFRRAFHELVAKNRVFVKGDIVSTQDDSYFD